MKSLLWLATSSEDTNHFASSSVTSSKTSPTSLTTTLSSLTPTMPSSSPQREGHRPVYDAFTVPGGAKSSDPFLIRSQSNPNQHSSHVAWSTSAADSSNTVQQSLSMSSSTFPSITNLPTAYDVLEQPLLQQNDVIASLPNCVVDSARRPSTHEGVNCITLTKAPGDVSMSPQQLILCLSAASKKLSPNIYRGVQLRISELKDAIDEGRISDRCLKTLNYVVDSIDREKYDDAHTFLND